MRFYQSLKGPLKIYSVEGGYVIGIKHDSNFGGTVAHNCVHNDSYVFVLYSSLELAKAAAEKIMELRKIPIRQRIEVG